MGNHTKPPSQQKSSQTDKKRAKSAKRERRSPIWRILGYTCLALGACITVVGGAAVGYVTSMLKGLPAVSAETFTNKSAPSVVYDRTGQVIGKFAADGDRQPITSVDQVSPYIVNSFIAAEDKTFYKNIGVNPIAMGRAFLQDLIGHKIMSGASTITQQTVKLALFPEQERTMKRKLQEIALAVEVNNMLSKDEIMTDYMNWVYMGRMGNNNVYGVKVAAQIMFHKDAKDLTLAQSAFLAAIPNNALLFSPYDNPKNTLQRQHYILQQMLANGMVTQQQYDEAMKEDVVKELQTPPADTIQYPYVLRDNVEPLVAQYLVDSGKYATKADAEKALPTAGFQIHTTIDLSAQNNIESVLKNDKLFKGSTVPAVDQVTGKKILGKDGKPLQDMYQAGATLIDNETGGILAIGGGRDFSTGAYIDHSNIARKPGSSIKPILDYGPAIDMHQITAATPLFDAPVTYPGGDGKPYKPQDDDAAWMGIQTAREALVESRNVPAIKVLDMIHPQVAGKYLAKMGLAAGTKTLRGQTTVVPDDFTHLSTAIGGMSNGVTVQQMTSAYTVFPNQGMYRPAFMVSKVTDRDGNVLYQHQAEAHQVFSAQTAYIMTDILHGVLYSSGGTAGAIGSHFPGYYISGKTGTTDDYRDGWFVGYTQKYTMGIWMGYDYNERIGTWSTGYDWYDLKFTLWNKMMDPILKKDPPTKPFPKPTGITSLSVSTKSGLLPTDLTKKANDVYTELFIQGTEPTTTDKTVVSASYTVINGQKYLATTNTPPGEVRQGIFLVPPEPLPPGVKTADSGQYVPTQPDPRGGTVLQGPSTGQIQTLPAPSNVQVSVDKTGAVQLAWSPVQGATGYTVWRANSPDGPYVNLAGPVTSTTYVDNTVPATAAQLYYEVYAVSDSGLSAPSTPVAAVISGQPAPPGGTDNNATGNSTNPAGPGGTGGKGTNSTGNNTTGTHHGNGLTLPNILWPDESQYRQRD